MGYKEFELYNHLGNVIATVSDRKVREFGTVDMDDDFSTGTTDDWAEMLPAAATAAVILAGPISDQQ